MSRKNCCLCWELLLRNLLAFYHEKLELLPGCSKSVVGLVILLVILSTWMGHLFVINGCYLLAQLYNVHLSLAEMLSIIGILMLTSKGAAGVTGSALLYWPLRFTAIHKIPVEGLAFLLGVEQVYE
ncbi:hypothetical protein CS542_02835 [Pedobacter sp. IW39]|nr:hypothetical protein CS542_02835 [Pedobacter sp. IW39]